MDEQNDQVFLLRSHTIASSPFFLLNVVVIEGVHFGMWGEKSLFCNLGLQQLFKTLMGLRGVIFDTKFDILSKPKVCCFVLHT